MKRQTFAVTLMSAGMHPCGPTVAVPFAEWSPGVWRNENPIQIPIRDEPYIASATDSSEMFKLWSDPLWRNKKDEEPRGLAQFARGSLCLKEASDAPGV